MRAGYFALCALWSLAACETNETCMATCAALAQCGMLPSRWGSEIENCAARCENSEPGRIASFKRCGARRSAATRPGEPTPALSERPWWPRDATPISRADDYFGPEPFCRQDVRGPSDCDEIYRCLQEGYPSNPDVAGTGTVSLFPLDSLWRASAARGAIATDGGVDGAMACEGLPEQSWQRAAIIDPAARCAALGARMVTFFVERAGKPTVTKSVPCESALIAGHRFEAIEVGVVTAGVMIDGVRAFDQDGALRRAACVSGSEPGCTAYCNVFYAPQTPIVANRSHTLPVHIPASDHLNKERERNKWATCENTADTCMDGLDNDLDAVTDCDDSHCAEASSCH